MARKSGVVKETATKTVKKLPVSENGPGVLCTTTSGRQYQISQNIEKMRFTLWKIVDGSYIKMATANSPLDLEDLVPWDK